MPKERFVSYPFCERDADGSPVVTCAGFDHLQQAQAVAHYYLERKEREGWSHERLLPLLAGVAGSLFQTVAGACLMAGILVFPAALGLAAFTVAASLMLLDFWNKVGPEREATMNAALCNVAIIGGLFIAAAISPI